MKTDFLSFLKKSIAFSLAFIITFALLECVSFFILLLINPNAGARPTFSRQLSGYTIFRNTPNFTDLTTKEKPGDKDVKTDQYGFICDEVITPKKDSGVIRIFLMGGSAACSAGQMGTGNCYSSVKEFPTYIYSYNISIAGYLKKYLTNKFPAKKIQVINAACYEWGLHQSMFSYLETVNRFKPDIIVNMDGFNDAAGICTGVVYEMSENYSLGRFADLRNNNESLLFRSKTVQLVYYIVMRLADPAKSSKQTVAAGSTHISKASVNNTPANEGIPQNCRCITDTTVYNISKYNEIKPALIKNAGTWLSILNKYNNILQCDSVKFAFVLQPMLQRTANKQLAEYEIKMQQVDVFNMGKKVKAQNKKGFTPISDPSVDFTEINRLGSKEGLMFLTRKYFFDDYLSETIKAMSTQKGFAYCDMNDEIKDMDKDFEFYTDYCHLTKQGYQYTGEKIGAMLIDKGWIK